MSYIDKPVPRLRSDLSLSQYKENGEDFIVFHCKNGILVEPIALTQAFYYLLLAFDGKTSLGEFAKKYKSETGFDFDMFLLNQKLIELSEIMLLETEEYKAIINKLNSDYLNSDIRPEVCSGNSYSADKNELESELDTIFNSAERESIEAGANSIIVPHIDFRIGDIAHETYSAGYHSLRDTDADLFVIFGTSHYAFSDYYMLSKKHFSTPLGVCENDIELIEILEKEMPEGSFTIDEFAHKPEHSIEFQVVLLQHYFKGRKFKILPILVGSFYQFIQSNTSPLENPKIKSFTSNLEKLILENGRKPAYIASVDFSHIGRKFDDDYDASPVLPQIAIEDSKLIDSISQLDKESFFKKISDDDDKYKICGTSPIYSMLSSVDYKSSRFLKYNQWDEIEMRSAVTFASFALYK